MLETLKAYAGIIKVAAIIALLVLLIAATWKATSDHYEKIIASMEAAQADAVAKMQEQQLKDAAARDKLLHDAGEQHAQDQLRINSLVFQLNGVRIHFPTGAGGSSLPQGGAASGNQNGTCRMAASRADEYMAEAQRAINDIGQRCAQLNIDAIQSNSVNR